MLIDDIRPSTLTGIKRLANRLKKSEHVPLKSALDQAAQRASFQNFEHAVHVLGSYCGKSTPIRQLFLTSYWADRETYEIGRETLEIRLSESALALCAKSKMRRTWGLCNFRLAAPDHLVKDSLCPSQHYARDEICKAVRALRFMEGTGLYPCDQRRKYEATKHLDGDLPRRDHCSEWYDPSTEQFVLVDEPYSRPVVSIERAEWATRNNWHLQASSWPGIYFPYRCGFFVASEVSSKFDFGGLMRKIDALADPVTAESWKGISVRDHALFISPMATTPQDKRRAKAKGTIVRRPSRKTIPYHRDMIGRARKPNGRMTLTDHQQAGRMISAVLQSRHKPWGVNWPMERLMSTLVDWLYEDVSSRELEQIYDPIDIYYGGISEGDTYVAETASTGGVVKILNELTTLLKQTYPDCAPLRAAVQKIDTAIKITNSAEVTST
jgi:hypothetical protein